MSLLLKDPKRISYVNIDKRKLQANVLGRILYNNKRYIKKQNILCMPGISGWDIQFFSAYKALVNKIYAVEEDTEVFKVLQNTYGNSPFVYLSQAKTTEFLAETNVKFDIIYLDYYSNLNSVVRFDIDLIFSRKILNKGGKLVVNIYGARETVSDQYFNRREFVKALDYYNLEIAVTDDYLQRCREFNCFIMNLKRNFSVTCTAPSWARYKSNNAFMYTAWLTYNGSNSKGKSCNGAVKYATDHWFMLNGKNQVKTYENTSVQGILSSLTKHGMTGQADAFCAEKIWDFYNKHFYTPTSLEVFGKKTYQRKYTHLLRKMGLCPRVYSTEEDVINEARRIEKRDGFICWHSLQRAKISRKMKCHSQQDWEKIALKYGIKYKTQDDVNYLSKKQDRIAALHGFIDHLKTSKNKATYYHRYGFMRRLKIYNIEQARAALLNEMSSNV